MVTIVLLPGYFMLTMPPAKTPFFVQLHTLTHGVFFFYIIFFFFCCGTRNGDDKFSAASDFVFAFGRNE